MSMGPVLPVVVPLAGAIALLFAGRGERAFLRRAIALGSTLLSLAVSAWLLVGASRGELALHEVGGWPAPFGIALVVDRLSALMLVLTDVLALAAVGRASAGAGSSARFHALFQFQLVGLHGAFVTGDLFNLFVFFEILLIASYGLLVEGASPARLRAGIHYVTLNLAGSAVFLVALGTTYGALGTLNMADVALRVRELEGPGSALAKSAGLLLFVVFSLKAAAAPLHAWLPGAYPAAPPAAAALFAMMTKVGVYGILRISTLVFGEEAGEAAGLAGTWLVPVALLTQALGFSGALVARDLRRLQSHLLVGSVGVMLAGIGLATRGALAGALLYLVHSTLTAGATFLLADLVAHRRGEAGDRFVKGPDLGRGGLLGATYFALAIASVGLPPSPGFLGKARMLAAAIPAGPVGAWVLGVTLAGSFVALVACVRAGVRLFWDAGAEPPRRAAGAGPAPVLGLVACLGLLTLLAGPVGAYLDATAGDLLAPRSYVFRVLPQGER